MWTRTLDANSPDFGYTNDTVVATGDLECNAIDPAFLLDPTDGKLWLTYGSYIGYIRLLELDPKTGKLVDPNEKPVDLAVNCEASCMIYHDGWYYLLATHGSCCQGANSGYNIRVGRAKKIVGPFFDDDGIPMLQGGGKLLLDSGGRFVGPGHFGLEDLGDGVQKFSMHWEADLDRGGASVLDIRPLLWKDGWPVAGENMKEGTYEIESVRTATRSSSRWKECRSVAVAAAEAGVAGVAPAAPVLLVQLPHPLIPMQSPEPALQAAGGRGGGGRGCSAVRALQFLREDIAQVSTNWPTGDIDVRMANYLLQAQQKWTVTAVTNVSGYLGSPSFKITIAGTDRALCGNREGELVASVFTGAPEQLWRLDQLADGTWRVMPKSVPNSKEAMVLTAIGASSPTLAKFTPDSKSQHWLFKTP